MVFTTYAISVLTASLGITKFLQNGPTAILSNTGPLGGLVRWKFVLAYLSVMVSLVTKGLFGALVILLGATKLWSLDVERGVWVAPLIFGTFNILLHILFAYISIGLSAGFGEGARKVILRYPAMIVLPAFTYFAVGPKELSCCGRSTGRERRHRLVISKNLTVMNIGITVIAYVLLITMLILSGINCSRNVVGQTCREQLELVSYFLVLFSPVLLLSIIFTTIFLTLDKKCCCLGSQECLCSCCCGPKCYEFRRDCIDVEVDRDGIINMNAKKDCD